MQEIPYSDISQINKSLLFQLEPQQVWAGLPRHNLRHSKEVSWAGTRSQEVARHDHLRRLRRLLPPGQHPGLHLTQGYLVKTEIGSNITDFQRMHVLQETIASQIVKNKCERTTATDITNSTRDILMNNSKNKNYEKGIKRKQNEKDTPTRQIKSKRRKLTRSMTLSEEETKHFENN